VPTRNQPGRPRRHPWLLPVVLCVVPAVVHTAFACPGATATQSMAQGREGEVSSERGRPRRHEVVRAQLASIGAQYWICSLLYVFAGLTCCMQSKKKSCMHICIARMPLQIYMKPQYGLYKVCEQYSSNNINMRQDHTTSLKVLWSLQS
jgi:hypothetical protein